MEEVYRLPAREIWSLRRSHKEEKSRKRQNGKWYAAGDISRACAVLETEEGRVLSHGPLSTSPYPSHLLIDYGGFPYLLAGRPLLLKQFNDVFGQWNNGTRSHPSCSPSNNDSTVYIVSIS